MALLPQKPRDQAMVMVTVVALAALGLFYMYVFSPKQEQLAALETHATALDSLNQIAKREVAAGTVEKVKRDAEQYTVELTTLRQLVPTSNEVPALLESVSSASRRVGLDLAEVIPEGVTPGDEFDTYKYRLGVSGPYNKVAQFLTNIGNLQRIVAPINVTLVPSARSDLKSRKGEQLLDARFEIQTYVAHGAAVKLAAKQ